MKTFDRLEQLEADKLYVSGMTSKEIANLANVNPTSVDDYLKKKGVPKRKAAKRESLRQIPPVGHKYGQWTVISEQVKTDGQRNICWLCQCDCGAVNWKQKSALLRGASKGCSKCRTKKFITADGDLNLSTFLISKYKQIKDNVKDRKKVGNLPFTITPEDLQQLYDTSHYCALSGIDISIDRTLPMNHQNFSVDRINSNKGYEKDNIQLVDKRINMMKGSLSNEEFIKLCTAVADYNRSKCN